MSRVETIGDATLYLGDCLEILPTLDEDIGVILTDPPYGISYSSGMGGKFLDTSIAGDADTSVRDMALSKLVAPALIFGTWKQPRPLGTRHVLIWEKGDHVGMGDLSVPWRPNTEEIYVLGGGFHGHRGSSVLRVNAPSPNFTPPDRRYHPTEKPVSLLTVLLDKCQSGGVLDPFMGSGSTGVAAVETGRSFIGIEIEPKYFDIACERIDNAYRQQRMFA